jgi:hypothetical protein
MRFKMFTLGVAALLATGCVAVPYDSYYGDGGYYYPAPAVSGTIVYHDYDNAPRYRSNTRYYHDDGGRYRDHRHDRRRDRDRRHGRAWDRD